MNEDQASGWWACFICQLALSWSQQISPHRGQMLEPRTGMSPNCQLRDRPPVDGKKDATVGGTPEVLELRRIPPESRFQPKEASCPRVYTADFPPLLVCRGIFYSWEMPGVLRRILSRGVIIMNSSCQWNKPD